MATSTPNINKSQPTLRICTAFAVIGDEGNLELMGIGRHIESHRYFYAPLDLNAPKQRVVQENSLRACWGFCDFHDALKALMVQEHIVSSRDHVVVKMY